jgi:putative holliday junction resolvase
VKGRVLAVDLGDVRVGLAISDPDRIVATPLDTLPVDDPDDVDSLIADLAEVIQSHEVSLVVVGLPRSLSGREGQRAQRAREVARRLTEQSDVAVDMWDERFTSVEAEKAMLATGAKRRERRAASDRVAATLLLQAYLDAGRGDGSSASSAADGGETR